MSLSANSISVLSIIVLLLSFAIPARATSVSLFSDDFESGLSQWIGKSGGFHGGLVVVDPLNSANNVLSFSRVTARGDVFTEDPLVSPSGRFILSFDYLGLAGPRSPDSDDLGGFIGYSVGGTPGTTSWLGGTSSLGGGDDNLIDDGTWHSYSFEFGADDPVRIMIEDFHGLGGIPGDVFIDNVRVQDANVKTVRVPDPGGSASMLVMSVLSVIGLRAGIRGRRLEARDS